jgi:S1-C subfamily serine protease
MTIDMSVEMIHATVQLDQPLGDGTRTVGTGFLINAPTADGKPRIVLVTATHVLDNMPGKEMRIGYRVQSKDGQWSYEPQKITIRAGVKTLWTSDPGHDVSAIVVSAPEEFAKAAIPIAWLGQGENLEQHSVGPGDEMMALGFPEGLAANAAGFPILRSGRVASYPLTPSKAFPTFLLDFSVYPGNSGGPVFVKQTKPDGSSDVFITGMLTQQVELTGKPLEIGVVTQAGFIRETVGLLDRQSPKTALAAAVMTRASDAPHQAFSASNAAALVSK